MDKKHIVRSILIALPFLAVEVSPLSGSWVVSTIIWLIFLIILIVYNREFIKRIRIRSPIFTVPQNSDKIATPPCGWLEEVVSGDRESLTDRIHYTVQWVLNEIKNREPYIDIIIKISNCAVFPVLITGVTGRLAIGGEFCGQPAELQGECRIEHAKEGRIRIRQYFPQETGVFLISHKNTPSTLISLNNCQLVIQPEEPGVENEQVKIQLQGEEHY